MRWFVLAGVVALGACASPAPPPAPLAAADPPGHQGKLRPAPVPGVMPGVPAESGPAPLPEQVVAPGATAGPIDSTPFSTIPSAELPPDDAPRDSDRSPAAVPNLSK
jgi:hypothetical protein